MKLLLLFIGLNVVNVILQTYKSIATINYGKLGASLVNAIAYGLYTVVIIYTTCELPLWEKVVVVALTNLVGVYIVKLIEEKTRKEMLWKVEATISDLDFCDNKELLDNIKVPHNYIPISNEHYIVNFYCSTCKQSEIVKNLLNEMNAKYFVSESKQL